MYLFALLKWALGYQDGGNIIISNKEVINHNPNYLKCIKSGNYVREQLPIF